MSVIVFITAPGLTIQITTSKIKDFMMFIAWFIHL